MTKPLLTAIALLFSAASFGQDYIVTLRSDTITGEVRLMSYDLLDRVQITVGNKKSNYTALQVRRVRENGEEYAPVKFENSIRLMKAVRSGFLSLYSYRAVGQSSYDTRVLQKIGTSAIEVPNIGFKKFVGELVADCPTVADKVKNGDYDRNKVEDLVDQYNQCITDFTARRVEAASQEATPATDLIEQMRTKVTASDLTNKTDVNDLLNSIADKVKKKEAVPAYMREGLKGYLSTNEGLHADMEKLFTLIDK